MIQTFSKDAKTRRDRRANSKITLLLLCVLFVLSRNARAQHLRIFACAIANDSAGAFLGGSSNGSGLYQSDDTGKTWKHLGWDNIKCYSMDMVQSSNGRILYEATGLGILRSTDYGESWKQLTDWRISEAMDVAINRKNPNEIYIATAHGPWRTKDGGGVWQRADSDATEQFALTILLDSNRLKGLPETFVTHWIQFEGKPSKKFEDEDLPYQKWCDCSEFPDGEGGPSGFIEQRISYGLHDAMIVGVRVLSIPDISSCLDLGDLRAVGSLGNGVFVTKRAGKGYYDTSEHWIQSLPHRQIWALKSFLITP